MTNRAARITEVLRDCLFSDDELPENATADNLPVGAVLVEGILGPYAFHGERLATHKEDIRELLTDLPKDFYANEGGGTSTLNLCMDADGNQWGEHCNMNELCVLAIGVGLGKWCVPREMWSILPGSMPYVVFSI